MLSLCCHFVLSGVTIILLVPYSCCKEWTYTMDSKSGPHNWNRNFPSCGTGRQSPINIETKNVYYDSTLTAFDWVNYGAIPRNAHWEMLNNGHSVQVVLDGDYQIWDGGLPGTFKAVYMSLHWGSNDNVGSEHQIDGHAFPMELQIVHYNLALGSYDEALGAEDGIAVMSFLFQLSPADNRVYDQLMKNMEQIRHKDEKRIVRPLPLLSFLPLNLNNYFRYEGSLTYPPCSPNVIWTVFEDLIEISPSQLNRLQTLLLSTSVSSSDYIVDNFRPIQPSGERSVSTSDPQYANLLSSPLQSPISITLAILLGFVVMFIILNRDEIHTYVLYRHSR